MFFKDFFQGQFSFRRTISEKNLLLKGNASFKKINCNVFEYCEQGIYTNTPELKEFYQKHIYKWDSATLNIYKRNEILHSLKFLGDNYPFKSVHCHVCGKDHYNLELTLLSDSEYQTHYTVKGPEKDYQIKTHYKRTD